MMKLKLLFLAGLVLATVAAYADVYQTYALVWSGAPFGNSAMAKGLMTLDLTTLPNPSGYVDIYNDIASLTVTVTGSSGGNGTFTKTDLGQGSYCVTAYTCWWTGGVTLNMHTQLVGQPTLGNAWGTPDGNSGDFNLFFNPPGPIGFAAFIMTADNFFGEPMQLASFAPTVPEPGTLIMLGTGVIGLAGLLRRKLNL